MMSNSQKTDVPVLKTLIFSVKDTIGILSEILAIFKDNGINVNRIESRPSNVGEWDYDFFIGLTSVSDETVDKLIKLIEQKNVGNIKLLSSSQSTKDSGKIIELFTSI